MTRDELASGRKSKGSYVLASASSFIKKSKLLAERSFGGLDDIGELKSALPWGGSRNEPGGLTGAAEGPAMVRK